MRADRHAVHGNKVVADLNSLGERRGTERSYFRDAQMAGAIVFRGVETYSQSGPSAGTSGPPAPALAVDAGMR